MKIENMDQIMRADIMLARIQDKNELVNAGDIYVGTGNAPTEVDKNAGEDGKVANPTVKNIQTALREDINRQTKVILGTGNAGGNNSIALGHNANASANSSIALGNAANASAYRSIALGNNASASGDSSISLGNNASASNTSPTAERHNAKASASQ